MLLSPLRYINPISGNRGGSAGFSIAKSFYLDGVDEYFNADDVYTNNSTDTVGTLSVVVKSVDILPSAVSFIVTFARSTTDLSSTGISQKTTGEVQITYVNSSSVKWVVVTDNPIDLTSWTKIDLVQDGVLPIIYINGVAVAQTTTVSTNTTLWLNDVVLDNFRIGQQDRTGGTTYDFNGYVSQVSYINTNLTPTQLLDLYNGGKPKNPQSLFGANCKFFFNADNSGDTAQFTVTDSVNSITATSVNMEDADKTPITPYSDPISTLVTKYGFLNAWSGENVEINGTTTTAKDYLAEHDLANPTVASQPTFVGGSADFNNRPIIDFDGVDDQLTKAVANWRSADSSGCFVAVINTTGNYYFSTNDNSSNSSWFSMYKSGLNIHGLVKNGSIMVESTNSFTGANVYGAIGTGVEFKEFINGVDETTNQASYSWLDSLPTQRDDITMGATTRLSNIFANCEVAFIGYLPYTDDATIIACQNELKTIFGI